MAEEPIREKIQKDLRRRLPGSPEITLESFAQQSVGWSHEIFLFDAVWKEGSEPRRRGFCLRKDPGCGLLREMSSLEEQFRVLKALEPTAVPTPKVYWYEPDPSILGGPFLVMEKVPGNVPNPWSKSGEEAYAEAAVRGVLPRSFTEALAALHNVDWKAAGLDFLGVPGPGKHFALREVAKWEAFAREVGGDPHPVLLELFDWLKANAPECRKLVLVHGAYRTGNLLIDDDRISAILDWELQVIGDPMYDVSYVLSELNRGGSPLLSQVVPREQFFEDYQRLTGIEIDLEACRYYDLLYTMRTAIFWLSASHLFSDGKSKDLRLARTTYALPVVLDMAAKKLGF